MGLQAQTDVPVEKEETIAHLTAVVDQNVELDEEKNVVQHHKLDEDRNVDDYFQSDLGDYDAKPVECRMGWEVEELYNHHCQSHIAEHDDSASAEPGYLQRDYLDEKVHVVHLHVQASAVMGDQLQNGPGAFDAGNEECQMDWHADSVESHHQRIWHDDSEVSHHHTELDRDVVNELHQRGWLDDSAEKSHHQTDPDWHVENAPLQRGWIDDSVPESHHHYDLVPEELQKAQHAVGIQTL